MTRLVRLVALCGCYALIAGRSSAEEWPRWRGPAGNAVSATAPLPLCWSKTENIRWRTAIPGEGFSSPIVWSDNIVVTSSFEDGTRRAVHLIERTGGKIIWSKSFEHDDPERASAMTGHAASTPATDGERIIAFFGNAGVVCYDFQGRLLWRRDLGTFDSELGLATSPVIVDDLVVLVCDHDGDRYRSFDSHLLVLDKRTGETRWKTPRPGLFRSWSTPVLATTRSGERELIVHAQDHLRAYGLKDGNELWRVGGVAGWVTPSPVFAHGAIYAASGKEGPVMAVRPGGKGDVTASAILWKHDRVGPYVVSPIVYGDYLYCCSEAGVLTCYDSRSGKVAYRQRLPGKFTASPIAGDGKLYFTNEDGETLVVRAGGAYELLAENSVNEYCLASMAVAKGNLLLRTKEHLFSIGDED